MSAPAWDVVVIGGGANGLVAGCRLGKAGRRVLVLERSESAGGQGSVVEFAPGFRAAPLGIDPGWLPPTIAGALGLHGLEPVAVDTALTVAAGPREFLTLSRDPARASAAIAPHSRDDAAAWPDFTTMVRNLAGFLEVLYQVPAPDVDVRSLRDLLPLLSLGRKFRALGRRDMIEFLRTLPLSAWELLDDWFACGPLKAAVAAGGIQDFKQGPRSGGTGYVLLHHLVGAPEGSVRGRVPWRAGPGAFTESVDRAAQGFGVTVRTGAAVARILIHDDAAQGVVLESGEEIAASAVLSTADPARTFLEWVDPVWLDPEFVHAMGNIRHRGCTAFVVYALDALPGFPGLSADSALAGILSLTPDLVALERAADAAKYGTVAERPHVELTVPTMLWPGLAPAGRHVAIARVQYAPYRLRDGSWNDARRDALAARVEAAIEAIAPSFRSHVLHRAVWTPRDLEERFGLPEGASSQGELGLDQILFMRPVPGWGRHVTPISGLYLGGCGTHPGPGILGGAGWLAAARVLERAGA
jgi:phytoene dehydrogenase-like protein